MLGTGASRSAPAAALSLEGIPSSFSRSAIAVRIASLLFSSRANAAVFGAATLVVHDGYPTARIFRGVMLRSMSLLAASISALRRSYVVCRFIQNRGDIPK
jgi:hypothetical protein